MKRIPLAPGLVEEYLAGATLKVLAARYGVSGPTVLRRLKEAGVPRRPASVPRIPPVPGLVDDYVAGATLEALEARYGVSVATAKRQIEEAGVPRRSMSDALLAHWAAARKTKPPIIPGLVEDYLAGATLKELGTEYGVSIDVVVRRLEQAGVPRRSPSDAQWRRRGNREAATENPSEDHDGVPLT